MLKSKAIIRTGVLASLVLCSAHALAENPPVARPHLDWGGPIYCAHDNEGRSFRLQLLRYPNGSHNLLVAPNETDLGDELSRTKDCETSSTGDTMKAWSAKRYPMVPAIAEAPPGWYRDDSQRVFQVTFDMWKRFYIGAGWQPAFDPKKNTRSLERLRLESGLIASWIETDDRTRHTIRALEGSVVLPDMTMDGQLFRYDMKHSSTHPLMRLTTFFGTPRRYDSNVDVGMGLRMLGVHRRVHRTDDLTEIEYGEAHGSWSIWQSSDLLSYVQITAGGAAGELRDTSADSSVKSYFAPESTFSFNFAVDKSGFHQISGEGKASAPFFSSGDMKRRAGANLGYEVIFLAINDQPLSLRFDGNIDYRNDLPDRARLWDATATAGMRFSFWTPAKVDESLPSIRRRRSGESK